MEFISDLISSLALAFIAVNLIWVVRHRTTYPPGALMIGVLVLLFQAIHFYLHSSEGHLSFAHSMFDDLVMVAIATVNSIFNCKVKIEL